MSLPPSPPNLFLCGVESNLGGDDFQWEDYTEGEELRSSLLSSSMAAFCRKTNHGGRVGILSIIHSLALGAALGTLSMREAILARQARGQEWTSFMINGSLILCGSGDERLPATPSGNKNMSCFQFFSGMLELLSPDCIRRGTPNDENPPQCTLFDVMFLAD